MIIKQQGLFGDDEPRQQAEPPSAPAIISEPVMGNKSFLPEVKAEEAYPEYSDWPMLKDKALGCRDCRLRDTCRQVVFGTGPADSKIIFVGEGPGSDEDEEVYITNVVKCRPPGNRLPNPDEVKACRKYLEAEIRIIQPRIVVCLGAMATQTVVDPRAKIGQSRGKWLQRNGIKIMPTYHPAALLRNTSYKRPTWEDFKLIRDAYHSLT